MKILLLIALLIYQIASAEENLPVGKPVETYRELIQTKGPNASLLYNLGNAQYQAENFGEAILAYEQALILDPRSPDIKTNLELARKAAASFDADNGINPRLKLLYWLSYKEWLIFGAIILVLLAAISLARASEKLTGNVTLKTPVIILVTLFVLVVSVVILRYPELNRGIVVTDSAEVKISPFESADSKASLKAGRAVQILDRHEKFYRIENGWVSTDQVKPVVKKF
ncbi:MAG: tetratricopeptide repeat protein [Verrucomicrobiales bacterium]|nr:tetratricopeptide repeat protein [Verrucomicrobiales bacterium]